MRDYDKLSKSEQVGHLLIVLSNAILTIVFCVWVLVICAFILYALH
jgi:hypothetical protein